MKMKNLLFTCLFILLLSPVGQANELLQAAEKAYDLKNYKEAITKYEQLLNSGFKAYQLYFNLGNSYYRDKQLGKAIYNYELARKLNPNDEDVRINLGIATSKTIDQIDSKENFFISAVKSNLLSSFNTTGWAWLNICSFIVFCLAVFLFINTKKIIVKRISFLLGSVLLISFLVTYSLGYTALQSKYENKFAIILTREVKVMNEPTPAAFSKFSLHEGTKIKVVENNGDWVLIKLDNGNEGWLKIQDVGII
jgi:tetratricopeptide (TPR) repeat protein